MLNRVRLKDVPRSTRIGVLAGLAFAALLVPFLAYAGFAIANIAATWAGSAWRYPAGPVVGVIAFVMWLLVVLGVPALCGGLLGAGVHRVRVRKSGA